jgi:putative MATE family efflux protein
MDSNPLLKIPVRKAVFTLAWPAILAMMLESLATTVDMIMVGRLGAAQVASVGFCGMIFWALMAMSIGISIATVAIVARHTGAGKKEKANLIVGQALILALVVSVFVAVVTFFCAPLIFKAFGVEQDVFSLCVPYLRTLGLTGIFFALLAVPSGALRGSGDTRTPMFIGLIANVVHIGLNYVLIFGKFGFPEMGIMGAACGTLLSTILAAGIYAFLLFTSRVRISLTIRDFKWDPALARVIFRMAMPAALEQLVLQAGLLIYARFIVAFGTAALSGYQIGMQVLSLSFIPNTGFSVAASTLVGQNLGAGRKKEAKRVGWICAFWGVVSMCTMGVLYFFMSETLASFFVKDPNVIYYGAAFIKVVAFCQAGMAIFFTLSGALRGAGDTRSPLLVILLSMYGFRIPGAWIVTRVLGMGVEMAFNLLIIDYIIRVIAIVYLFHRGRWLDKSI